MRHEVIFLKVNSDFYKDVSQRSGRVKIYFASRKGWMTNSRNYEGQLIRRRRNESWVSLRAALKKRVDKQGADFISYGKIDGDKSWIQHIGEKTIFLVSDASSFTLEAFIRFVNAKN